MTGLTSFLMALVVLFPKIRNTAESAAVSVLIISLMGAFNTSGADYHFSSQVGVFGILICYLTALVYGGTWVDRFVPLRNTMLRSVAKSKLPPSAIWPYLYLTPDSAHDTRSAETVSLDWIEPGKSFRAVHRIGDTAKVEEIHSIETYEPFSNIRFSWNVPDAVAERPGTHGWREIRVIPHSGGSRLETIRCYGLGSWRVRLKAWIDDAAARLDDDLIRDAENSYLRELVKPNEEADSSH